MVLLGFDGCGPGEPGIQIIQVCCVNGGAAQAVTWIFSQANANLKPYARGQQEPRHSSQELFTKLGEHFMAITGTE